MTRGLSQGEEEEQGHRVWGSPTPSGIVGATKDAAGGSGQSLCPWTMEANGEISEQPHAQTCAEVRL